MTSTAPWGATPAARLGLAFAASLLVHAALLGNAAFAPGRLDLSLFAAGRPLPARLAAEPASTDAAWTAIPPVAEPRSTPEPQAKAAGMPGPEIFFSSNEVDQRAQPLNQVDMTYPEEALARGVEGVVTLLLKIDYRGVLREATVVSARPPGVFERSALEAARDLRFSAALRNGVAVSSTKTIEVPFYPDCRRTGSCIDTENRP